LRVILSLRVVQGPSARTLGVKKGVNANSSTPLKSAIQKMRRTINRIGTTSINCMLYLRRSKRTAAALTITIAPEMTISPMTPNVPNSNPTEGAASLSELVCADARRTRVGRGLGWTSATRVRVGTGVDVV